MSYFDDYFIVTTYHLNKKQEKLCFWCFFTSIRIRIIAKGKGFSLKCFFSPFMKLIKLNSLLISFFVELGRSRVILCIKNLC